MPAERGYWDAAHIRGAVLAVRVLRDRWRHLVLLSLGDGPRRPHDLFTGYQRSLAEVGPATFGALSVYPEQVHRALSALSRMGMAEHATAGLAWRRTALGNALIAATMPVHRFTDEHLRMLVRMSQFELRVPAEWIPEAAGSVGARRCGSVIAFGMVLRVGWTTTMLATMSAGPATTATLVARIEDVWPSLSDVKPVRISPTPLYRRLPELGAVGLVAERGHGVAGSVWELRPSGVALLASLEQVARFGVAHDAVMTRAVMTLRRSGAD